MNIQEIIFGNFGGFTGAKTEYSLNPEGDVTLFSSAVSRDPESRKPYAKWDEKATLEIFKEVDALNIPTTKFNFPGNMTYYLRVVIEGQSSEVVWGQGGKTPPAGVQEMYDRLMKRTREQ